MKEEPETERPSWRCPRCEGRFAQVRQPHSCGPPAELAAHFHGRDPSMYQLYEELLSLVRQSGPVAVLVEKARIVFQVRTPFMAIAPRQMHLIGHFVLARRVPSPRFQKIETISPGNHVHHFCLERPTELDEEFAAWTREAYARGRQEKIESPTRQVPAAKSAPRSKKT